MMMCATRQIANRSVVERMGHLFSHDSTDILAVDNVCFTDPVFADTFR